MRIGGAYGFGQQAVPISLPGGGQFYLPPGNWQVTLGLCTVLQWFDSQQLKWRVYSDPMSQNVKVDSDGANWRMWNMSGVVISTSITNAGTTGTNGIGAAATGAAVTFGAAPTNGLAAAAYPIVGGAINTTVAITQAGSGFVAPPILLVDPPPAGGIQATARCTISAGAINAVTVDNAGAGYSTAPAIRILPQFVSYPGMAVPPGVAAPVGLPPGLIAAAAMPQGNFAGGLVSAIPDSGGALLTVNATLAGSGTLTGIVITQGGVGYAGTTIPTIAITGVGAAAATAVMAFSFISGTVTAAGAAVSVAPIWETSLGQISRSGNNSTFLGRVARGTTVLSTTTVGSLVVEDPGFGLQSVPAIAFNPGGGTPWTTNPAATAVVGGIQDTSVIQPATGG